MKSKSSGLGLAFIIAGLFLIFSPETRKLIRQLMVRGTSGFMELLDEIRGVAEAVTRQEKQNSIAEVDGPTKVKTENVFSMK